MLILETCVSKRPLSVEAAPGVSEEEFLSKLAFGKLRQECNHFYDVATNKVLGKISNMGEFKQKITYTSGD